MEKINQIISDYLKREEGILYSIISNENYIKDKILEFIKSPTKRIRTVFTVLYLKSQGAEISDNVFNIITAGELIHNASLLHDDVVDDAESRRNKTSFAKEISPKMSIIAGDLLVSKAVELIINENCNEISRFFINCTKQMSEAEILQYTYKGKTPNLGTYLDICKGKTSSLFIAILKSAAKLSKLDVNIAEEFATIFGLVFQIKNDLEPESAYNDKANEIVTVLDIIGLEKTNVLIDNYKEKMRSIIKDFPDNKYSKGLNNLINLL